MATMVAAPATVTKKPSIKKYRAPTPPNKILDENSESDKDKENNVVEREENDNGQCIQTKQDDKPALEGSPVIRRVGPRLNGNVDRSSVLSKAAMFEAGSPRSKEKDPAEMSLRERKALFEKNKGAAIMPKAAFGLAPSVKTLHGDAKGKSKFIFIQCQWKYTYMSILYVIFRHREVVTRFCTLTHNLDFFSQYSGSYRSYG